MQSSIFMYGWIDVDMITSISLCLSLISLQLVILIKMMKTFNSPFKKKHFKFRPYWLKYEQTIVTKLRFTMDFLSFKHNLHDFIRTVIYVGAVQTENEIRK